MATLANSTTHVQWAPNVQNAVLGQSSSTNRTVVRGGPIYKGTDADGNTDRVIEITDISAHESDGLALTATADVVYTNDQISIALWPLRILTNNVVSGAVPTVIADSRVYLHDEGQWSNADDADPSGHSYGRCTGTETLGGVTYYQLNLTGRDET